MIEKKRIDAKYENLFGYLDSLYYGDPSEKIINLEKQQAILQMMNYVKLLSLAGVSFSSIKTGGQLMKKDPRLENPTYSSVKFGRQIKSTDIFLDVEFRQVRGSDERNLKLMDCVGTALGYNKIRCFVDRYFIIKQMTQDEMFDKKTTRFFHNTATALEYAKDYWERSGCGTQCRIDQYIQEMFGEKTAKNALTIDFLKATYERFNGWEMANTEAAMYESLVKLMNQDMQFRSYTTPGTTYVKSKENAIKAVQFNINNSINSMLESDIINQRPEEMGKIKISTDTPYEEVMKYAICYALEEVSESVIMQPIDVPTAND